MGCEGTRAPLVHGPVHHAIDTLVNTDATTRRAFLQDLHALQPPDSDQTEGYLALLARYIPSLAQNIVGYGFVYDFSSLDYLHDAWYNPRGLPKPRTPRMKNMDGFWPGEYHPTEPLVRLGLIKALELAIEANLPLASYWLAAGNTFETVVLRDTHQVTRLLMTPPTPEPSHPERLWNAAHVWVVKGRQQEPWESPAGDRGSIRITKLTMM
jgi:hypothetical protein